MAEAKESRVRRSARRIKAQIRHAALTRMPVRLTSGGLTRNRMVRRLRITPRDVILPELPDALDGLRIAHLSDLHVGELIPPDRLPEIVEATNALEADLIAVTGDLVDLHLKVLPEVVEALAGLEAPLGVYFVLGNHDHLVDGDKVATALTDAGLNLLMNEQRMLDVRGCAVRVSGIDFAHRPIDLTRMVRRAIRPLRDRPEADLSLLLSHHPDGFDPACRHDVDLTLAGHTHGGHVTFLNGRGKKGSMGLGSLAFRYPRGLYRRGYRYLYVTTGVGSWFPVRFNCPPEIACLTLQGQPDPAIDLSHP